MGNSASKIVSTNVGGTIITEYEWTVSHFQKLSSCAVGYCTNVAVVASGLEKYSFRMCLYPHGFNERTENYVSVWLKKESERELSVRFTCAIVDGTGEDLCRKSVKQNLALESVLGWATFCKRNLLLDENKAPKEDTLTFKCIVETFVPSALPNAHTKAVPFHNTLSELSDNFHQLQFQKTFADFSLKVGGETIHVHKAVLSARSPVFKTMFQSPLHKDIKQIQIKDITFKGLQIVVKYIYTGKIDFLSVQIAMDVYYAADKYEVIILRDICSTMLSNNLLPDNVIKVLLLAYRHSDKNLQESCFCFMDKNLREMKGRPEWIYLMRNFPSLADKALFYLEIKKLSQS